MCFTDRSSHARIGVHREDSDDRNPEQAHAYVSNLDLPAHGPSFEAAGEEVQFGTAPHAAVIGAQIAACSEGVDANTRSAVADSLLIAQLAPPTRRWIEPSM
ncbi:hypothetical protein QTI24_29730 [Variovorax sp. J22P240]|uniref:hypothetical protein n=1 Tax=Variovorax sp. J22P240 TaxID=3053514 RepID=UPI002578C711|nr:hypothetical protein [Variovorax sp. J22P240]MDM0002804.1 hypothetical protein [Variovorax sp. J22P240]